MAIRLGMSPAESRWRMSERLQRVLFIHRMESLMGRVGVDIAGKLEELPLKYPIQIREGESGRCYDVSNKNAYS